MQLRRGIAVLKISLVFQCAVEDIPKAVGTPSQIIAHFGLVLHPFLFT
jgi:hypothetical protein